MWVCSVTPSLLLDNQQQPEEIRHLFSFLLLWKTRCNCRCLSRRTRTSLTSEQKSILFIHINFDIDAIGRIFMTTPIDQMHSFSSFSSSASPTRCSILCLINKWCITIREGRMCMYIDVWVCNFLLPPVNISTVHVLSTNIDGQGRLEVDSSFGLR